MEDRDFFDLLYQEWSKTTGASSEYWVVEQDEEAPDVWNVYAVDEEQRMKLVASTSSVEDADFIAAVHGAIPDLVRRLHSALDEADSADYDRDSRECRIAELELENAELRQKLASG